MPHKSLWRGLCACVFWVQCRGGFSLCTPLHWAKRGFRGRQLCQSPYFKVTSIYDTNWGNPWLLDTRWQNCRGARHSCLFSWGQLSEWVWTQFNPLVRTGQECHQGHEKTCKMKLLEKLQNLRMGASSLTPPPVKEQGLQRLKAFLKATNQCPSPLTFNLQMHMVLQSSVTCDT